MTGYFLGPVSVQRLAEFVVVKVISPLTIFVPMGKSASGVSSSADATDMVMIIAITILTDRKFDSA